MKTLLLFAIVTMSLSPFFSTPAFPWADGTGPERDPKDQAGEKWNPAADFKDSKKDLARIQRMAHQKASHSSQDKFIAAFNEAERGLMILQGNLRLWDMFSGKNQSTFNSLRKQLDQLEQSNEHAYNAMVAQNKKKDLQFAAKLRTAEQKDPYWTAEMGRTMEEMRLRAAAWDDIKYAEALDRQSRGAQQ
jgi:hypothetical protein